MVALMQGRLTPPHGGHYQPFPGPDWAREFEVAAELGLEAIEWVYDATGVADDPLQNGTGTGAIAAVVAATGVAVRSVCADWFMTQRLAADEPDERAAARLRLVEQLLPSCADLGVQRVVLPFVDNSSADRPGGVTDLVQALETVLPRAVDLGIELHLETDLGPDVFRALLDALPEPSIRVNYDIGNSAGLGFLPEQEFAAYGDRLGSVHIKDRVRGGFTVPLGTGDADFPSVAASLAALDYRGPFVLQAARGEAGDETAHVAGILRRAQSLLPGAFLVHS